MGEGMRLPFHYYNTHIIPLMDYRNLNRSFVMNKALYKSRLPLLNSDVYVLLSLAYGCDSILTLQAYLSRYKRTLSPNEIQAKLEKLSSFGYINKVGGKYLLSLAGRNALNDLERRCREMRIDR